MPHGPSPTKEIAISWLADVLAAVYFLWMGFHLWRSTKHFGEMFDGLGADLPAPTAFLVQHGGWFYPLVFGSFVLLVFGKEFVIRDKRVSTMITFVLAILGQFLAHWMTTVYYLPLFELIGKLG
jgi:hypothetical protein